MSQVIDDDGRPLAAQFEVQHDGDALAVILHSAGGKPRGGSGPGRNADYPRALEIILSRLGQMRARLVGVVLDSTVANKLPLGDRILDISRPTPLYLAGVEDFDALRRDITRAQKNMARAPGALSSPGGNERKRIKLILDFPGKEVGPSTLELLVGSLPDDRNRGPEANKGQGPLLDAGLRVKIEQMGMVAARGHYEQEGWTVEDVSQQKVGYDFLCVKAGVELHLEVKGTTTGGASVRLTSNEVAHALHNPTTAALFVLHNIKVDQPEQGQITVSGGETLIREPWNLNMDDLTCVSFAYTLD